jgi:hypothetical protein
MWAKSRSATAAVVAVVILFGVDDGSAENLSGLCLDNVEAGCMERFIPFYGNSIDFCEETCQLTNPTAIRDLNATLYDFVCQGDDGSATGLGGRVIVLHQRDWEGKTTTSFIDERETRLIVRCSNSSD